ncbi:MAG: methylated-DNA--[protein]-cysteine S-methyltransferase [Desulfobulbaceae bacterium]|nr:methylated-DNA--[protein]-cysteine S-methyltransferase [Desulfobulbaceae bacterium]
MSQPIKEYEQLVFSSTVGDLLITACRAGIVEVSLPGCSSRYKSEDRFSGDLRIKGLLERAAAQIDAYLRGINCHLDLPLVLRGTPFQLAVWRQITVIPYGETCSYGEIARRLGGVGKARAVGNAAGANPVPLFIPCHRVVGAQGRLGGFSAELSLKQYLLAMEKNTKLNYEKG